MSTEKSIGETEKRFDMMWLGACALITAVAAFLRFFWLELKPLHHDEGVNGHFLEKLFNDGVYRYDPTNYHGPDLYYISLVFAKLFGLNTVSVRMSVAIFGVLTVLLVFFLRDYLGKVGTLTAGLLLALSPGMVYISRYFIHEIIFVFLSLALVVSVVLFIKREKAGPFAVAWMVLVFLTMTVPTKLRLAYALAEEGSTKFWIAVAVLTVIDFSLIALLTRMLLDWDGGRPIYVLLASASAVMLFATKETAFITIGTMLIACGCVAAWRRIGQGVFGKSKEQPSTADLTFGNFKAAFGSKQSLLVTTVLAVGVFVLLGVLFFSSFFTNAAGVADAFRAYAVWTKTGTADHTQNGFFAYLRWGMQIETAIMLLSALGAAIALVRRTNRVAVFVSFWAFGMFAAYTIIPYKTPWLAVSFILPMCIIAGWAIEETLASSKEALVWLGALIAVAATGSLAYQTYTLNFVRYDDDKMPYVYAHTRREFLGLVREIGAVSERSGKGLNAIILIASPDYWPLTWYLMDYPSALFHGKFVEAKGADMIVTKVGDREGEQERRYGASYESVGEFPLRPGVTLRLLVRKELLSRTSPPVNPALGR